MTRTCACGREWMFCSMPFCDVRVQGTAAAAAYSNRWTDPNLFMPEGQKGVPWYARPLPQRKPREPKLKPSAGRDGPCSQMVHDDYGWSVQAYSDMFRTQADTPFGKLPYMTPRAMGKHHASTGYGEVFRGRLPRQARFAHIIDSDEGMAYADGLAVLHNYTLRMKRIYPGERE